MPKKIVKRLAKKIEAEKKAAEDLKSKLDSVTLEVTKKVGGSGKLFGFSLDCGSNIRSSFLVGTYFCF